VVFREFKG